MGQNVLLHGFVSIRVSGVKRLLRFKVISVYVTASEPCFLHNNSFPAIFNFRPCNFKTMYLRPSNIFCMGLTTLVLLELETVLSADMTT